MSNAQVQGAAVSPAQSTASGNGLLGSQAGKPGIVTITPRDSYGNPSPPGAAGVSADVRLVDAASAGVGGSVVPTQVEWQGDGSIRVTYMTAKVCPVIL